MRSMPKGTETDWKRATRANCKPIMANPTKPKATEKLMRNPRPGVVSITAKTSGAAATAKYTNIQKAARTASFTALPRTPVPSCAPFAQQDTVDDLAPQSGRKYAPIPLVRSDFGPEYFARLRNHSMASTTDKRCSGTNGLVLVGKLALALKRAPRSGRTLRPSGESGI